MAHKDFNYDGESYRLDESPNPGTPPPTNIYTLFIERTDSFANTYYEEVSAVGLTGTEQALLGALYAALP